MSAVPVVREHELDELDQPADDYDAAARWFGDQQVVQAILDEGLHGPRHRALEDTLIRYALPVLRKLLADGRLVGRAARLGRPAASPGTLAEFTATDREEFARDMVADALPVFTCSVFEQRRWSPDGRASLKTYFVNACILQFAQLHRQWLDQRRALQPAGLEVDAAVPLMTIDPAVTVALRDEVDRLLAGITDPQLRKVLILRGAGYTAEDAARLAGLTLKAAEGRLTRLRRSMKRARRGTDSSGSTRHDTNPEGRRAQ